MAQTGTDITRAATDLTHAFNEADWDKARSMLTPDVIYSETGTGRRVEGIDAYTDLLKEWKAALPDVTGTIRITLAGDDVVAQEILWEGTHTGPLQTPAGTLEATGARVTTQGTLWITFDGDKVREVRNHLDVLGLLQQIGALPA
jgi:predicted ester cyclase